MKEQKKDVLVTVRFTPEEYAEIKAKADTARMAPSSYIRTAALRHRVVVLEGLKEFTREMKGVGRNLNQLTMLAHEGRVTAPDLSRTAYIRAKTGAPAKCAAFCGERKRSGMNEPCRLRQGK